MGAHAHSRPRLVSQYGEAEVQLAEAQVEAERRSLGRPGRTTWEVLANRPQRGQRPTQQGLNLCPAGQQRLPGKGSDVLAAMLDQDGLRAAAAITRSAATKLDPVRRAEARKLAEELEGVATGNAQIEFDLWEGGSVNLGHLYWDEMRRRLVAANTPPLHQAVSQAVLAELMRHMEFGSSRVLLSASELAELMRMQPASISRTLACLESIGAIWRVQAGRQKVIHINPEGAFRGGPGAHRAAVLEFAKVTGNSGGDSHSGPPEAA